MKTKNIFRMLLLAVMLLGGTMNVQAGEIWTGPTSSDFKVDKELFNDVDTATTIQVYVSNLNVYYWSLGVAIDGNTNNTPAMFSNWAGESYGAQTSGNNNLVDGNYLEFKLSEQGVDAIIDNGLEFKDFRDVTIDKIVLVSGDGPVVVKHTLTIVVDETTTTKKVPVGAELASLLPANPTKADYTFTGWSGLPEDGLMPDEDCEVTANFIVTKYQVFFWLDNEKVDSVELAPGETVTAKENPTKIGYTFSGWNGYPNNMIMPNDNVNVNGSFSVNYHYIVYNVDGNYYDNKSNIPYGATLNPDYVPATNPSKTGYLFTGWIDLPETMPDEDLTIEAAFEVDPDYHVYKTITYYVDYQKVKEVTWEVGQTIIPEADSTKVGYTFSGWSGFPEDMVMPNNDVTINGNFTLNKHNIIYMVDGEEYKTVEYYYGSDIYPEQDPTQTGATFSGWSGFPEDMKMPDSDLTITGSFGVASYAVTYTYWINGASTELTTDYVAFGSTISTPEAPEIEGYTFNGWDNVPETMPANNLSISGSYTLNKYNIVYMVDGEVYKTVENYDYGATIYPEQYQAQEGETFSGWSGFPDDMKMPAHDLTITGSTGIASYTITYYIDGEQIAQESWDYGATITSTPDAPQREGYSFSWNGVPETMPANNITINGYYSINSHDVIYLLDGNEYGRDTYQYGATIYPKNDPSSEGYDFSGWSGFPEDMMMPDEDVIILGSFSEIVYYTLTLMLDENTVYRTITLPEGIAIPYINNPIKTGYTFTGWSGDVPETMPAEDMTLTAQFDEILYTLTFKVDNEDYGTSLQLAAGDAITLPDEPEAREGYTFSGWQNVRDYMPAQNWVIYGSFTKESEYETLSVGEAGFNTYRTTKPLYFQGSEDVKAYIAKAKNNNEVTLSQVVGSVAAGTGLVLRGKTANASAQFEVVTSGNSFSNNLLVGVSSETTINLSTRYVLVVKGGYVKFADTGNYPATVPAGKAYLDVPFAGSRMLSVFFEDANTTSIEGLSTDAFSQDDVIYNLRGQRVQNPGKGLYIVNGKKVYIK